MSDAEYTMDTKEKSAYFQKLAQGLDLPEYYTEFHSFQVAFFHLNMQQSIICSPRRSSWGLGSWHVA